MELHQVKMLGFFHFLKVEQCVLLREFLIFFFPFCFVFKVFLIKGWTNDVLSCESKSAIFANL